MAFTLSLSAPHTHGTHSNLPLQASFIATTWNFPTRRNRLSRLVAHLITIFSVSYISGQFIASSTSAATRHTYYTHMHIYIFIYIILCNFKNRTHFPLRNFFGAKQVINLRLNWPFLRISARVSLGVVSGSIALYMSAISSHVNVCSTKGTKILWLVYAMHIAQPGRRWRSGHTPMWRSRLAFPINNQVKNTHTTHKHWR